MAHAGVQVSDVLGSRNSVSCATEVDNKQREGVKNDNDVCLHFHGLEGVNRKVGIRDGRGHKEADKPGCPFSGRWEEDPGRQQRARKRKG